MITFEKSIGRDLVIGATILCLVYKKMIREILKVAKLNLGSRNIIYILIGIFFFSVRMS